MWHLTPRKILLAWGFVSKHQKQTLFVKDVTFTLVRVKNPCVPLLHWANISNVGVMFRVHYLWEEGCSSFARIVDWMVKKHPDYSRSGRLQSQLQNWRCYNGCSERCSTRPHYPGSQPLSESCQRGLSLTGLRALQGIVSLCSCLWVDPPTHTLQKAR